jgi:copper(I)-binding protein
MKHSYFRRIQGAAALLLASGLMLAAPARAEIVAADAWSRATVPGVTVGAGYVTLRNTGSETHKLLRLTSPVSDELALHQSSVDANGVARMWPVASLELKAGEQVRFEPNGTHIMLSELRGPLVAGTRVPVTFEFDGGEKPLTVQLQVRPLVADAPGATMDHSTMDRSKH